MYHNLLGCLQADIYKSDFEEERKDRAEARGKLEEEKDKFMKERADLYHKVNKWKQECEKLKMEHAKQEVTSQTVLDQHRKAVERLTKERDDLKNDIEHRKKTKHDKIKSYDKMRDQVKYEGHLSLCIFNWYVLAYQGNSSFSQLN